MDKAKDIIFLILSIILFIFSFLAVYYAKSSLDYSAVTAILLYLLNDMDKHK